MTAKGKITYIAYIFVMSLCVPMAIIYSPFIWLKIVAICLGLGVLIFTPFIHGLKDNRDKMIKENLENNTYTKIDTDDFQENLDKTLGTEKYQSLKKSNQETFDYLTKTYTKLEEVYYSCYMNNDGFINSYMLPIRNMEDYKQFQAMMSAYKKLIYNMKENVLLVIDTDEVVEKIHLLERIVDEYKTDYKQYTVGKGRNNIDRVMSLIQDITDTTNTTINNAPYVVMSDTDKTLARYEKMNEEKKNGK